MNKLLQFFLWLESLSTVQGYLVMAGILIAVILGTLYLYWVCMYSFRKKEDLPPYIEQEDDQWNVK